MNEIIDEILKKTDRYNLHSHTPWCDGKADMRTMVDGAISEGLSHYGVSPHSPVDIPSPCNMSHESVGEYLETMKILKEEYAGRINLLTGMEIDYLRPDYGPHIDYFRRLPLDYKIGSVHYVPTRSGELVDCDGSAERFAVNLRDAFRGDLRYVVERYFSQLLTMIESGGFDILGHPDKIAANASAVAPGIENEGWYGALIEDVARYAAASDIFVEINTKAYPRKGRFFPASRWWRLFAEKGCKFVVNSDAHRPDLTDAGRKEALRMLGEL
ncbi:MAG: histidinol-phosphatase [Bacteroidales bacterium]|nr:histidinol-phosphatase [Bacteroidales bacterium]